MIKQTEFFLKIREVNDIIYPDYVCQNYTISITAWDTSGHMIDQHITAFFPQLLDVGIEEICEGDMYSKHYTIDQLNHLLSSMGFIIEGSKKYKRLIEGKVIKEKIIPMNTLDEEIQMIEEELKLSVEEEDYVTAMQIRDELIYLKGKIEINISKDFGIKLGGRWDHLGPNSGEEFYEKNLKTNYERSLKFNVELHIYLDGVKGYSVYYGHSFLDQSFGELARVFGSKKVSERIVFHTNFFDWNVSHINNIWRSIK